jgi:CRP-like cAMP-binding protein
MTNNDDSIHDLAQMVLFSDLSRPELHEVDRILDIEFFDAGNRVVREGIDGSNFYVIIDGEAAVEANGKELRRLASGDYFGEVSLLLGQAPPGDVVALTRLRCRVLSAGRFEDFLLSHPRVMYRMLQSEAHRRLAETKWPE